MFMFIITAGSGARMAEIGGASEAQIRRMGRWNNQAMEGEQRVRLYSVCIVRLGQSTPVLWLWLTWEISWKVTNACTLARLRILCFLWLPFLQNVLFSLFFLQAVI